MPRDDGVEQLLVLVLRGQRRAPHRLDDFSTKTAVEFDGPTHYLQGPDGPSVDGRTAFKRRLLGRLGWTCAAVPYFEWDPLLASGATEPYLRGVLARLRSE